MYEPRVYAFPGRGDTVDGVLGHPCPANSVPIELGPRTNSDSCWPVPSTSPRSAHASVDWGFPLRMASVTLRSVL